MCRRGRFRVALGVPFPQLSKTSEPDAGAENRNGEYIGRTTGRLFGVWVFFGGRIRVCLSLLVKSYSYRFRFSASHFWLFQYVLFLCLFLFLSVCLSVRLSVCGWLFPQSCCGLRGDVLGGLGQIFGHKAGGRAGYFMEFPLPRTAP